MRPKQPKIAQPRIWNLTIRAKLASLFISLVAVISLSIYLYFPAKLEEQAFAAIKGKAESIALMTAFSITPSLYFDDPLTMKGVLEGTQQNKELVYAVVTGAAGRIIVAIDQAKAEETNFTRKNADDVTYLAQRLYQTNTPIIKDGDEIGQLYLGFSLNELIQEIKSSRARVAMVSVVIFLIGMFAVLGISAVIAKPIVDMAGTAAAITQGDLTKRAKVHSRDEVGILAEAFNGMLDKLESAQNELQSANENLEKRAEELQKEVIERQRAEDKLQVFAAQLERSNRELQDFAYVASHDLQEPLRKIQAFGDRLRAKCGDALSEQGLDYLERMQNAAGRMQDLINGLLNYSRVTTKAEPFSQVDLREITEDVLSDLEIRIEEKGAEVKFANLPTIVAAPLQVRQLLQNLIGNALKFNRPEKPPVVTISSEIIDGAENGGNGTFGGKFCQITVADNGIGFDEKYTDRIFGVFQRLHGRSEYKGTGIGLAVCRKIAEQHGGTITAKSKPKEGASFIVTLPFEQPDGRNET